MITKSLRLQFIICSFILFILPNRFLTESQDIENKNLQATSKLYEKLSKSFILSTFINIKP